MKNLKIIILILFISTISIAGSYYSHTIEMETLEGKIRTNQRKMLALIEEKKHTTNPEKIQEILAQIVESHKTATKALKKLRELKNHVKYEHPEKGQEVEEKYRRYNEKNWSDFEKDAGLEKVLDQALKTMDQKYSLEKKKQNLEPEPIQKKPEHIKISQ